MRLILLLSVSLFSLALHVRIFEIFYIVCIANRKKKQQSSTDNDATAMESADTFHHVASTPSDDRDYYNLTNVNVGNQDRRSYYNLPPTNVNVGNHAQLSAETVHSVAPAPPDDRNSYNLPTTDRNVTEADQTNYAQLSTVANDNHTYSHLNTTTGQ